MQVGLTAENARAAWILLGLYLVVILDQSLDCRTFASWSLIKTSYPIIGRFARTNAAGTDPECDSELMKEKFPLESEDYLSVKRKIEAHAQIMRRRAAASP
jgi:hypothetical protein